MDNSVGVGQDKQGAKALYEEKLQLESCVLALAQGNVSALETLYEKTHRALYAFILTILRNPHDTQDALQDSFVRIYQASGSYRPCGNPLPWMYTIAKNLALMSLRRQKRFCALPDDLLDETAGSRLPSDEKVLLETLLAQLSKEERQIVALHAISGFKHREIALVLELPLATVLSKYHRALRKLQKSLHNHA